MAATSCCQSSPCSAACSCQGCAEQPGHAPAVGQCAACDRQGACLNSADNAAAAHEQLLTRVQLCSSEQAARACSVFDTLVGCEVTVRQWLASACNLVDANIKRSGGPLDMSIKMLKTKQDRTVLSVLAVRSQQRCLCSHMPCVLHQFLKSFFTQFIACGHVCARDIHGAK